LARPQHISDTFISMRLV